MSFFDSFKKGVNAFGDAVESSVEKYVEQASDEQLFRKIATATSSRFKEICREELEKRGYSSYEIDEKVSEY